MNKLPKIEYFILSTAFLMSTSGFIVIPIFPLYLQSKIGVNIQLISLILGIYVVLGRFGPIIGGIVADTYGELRTLRVAILIRLMGFIGMGLSVTFSEILLFSLFIGLGGALFEPSIKSLVANMPQTHHSTLFVNINIVLNFGVILGPMLGMALLSFGIHLPWIIAGLCLFILLLVSVFIKYEIKEKISIYNIHQILDGLLTIYKNRIIFTFFINLVLASLLLSQIYYSIPIFNFNITGNYSSANLIFILNGTTGLIAMIFTKKYILRSNPARVYKLGIIMAGLGICCLAIPINILAIFMGIIIFTIGETFILTSSDILISNMVVKNIGTLFGVFEVGSGIGVLIGSSFAPVLANFATKDPYIWMTGGIIALLCIWLMPKKLM